MKKYLLYVFSLLVISSLCKAQSINSKPDAKGWTTIHPFTHNVFIENKGQFTEAEKKYIKQPILYYNQLGKVRLYFSTTSVTFLSDSVIKINDNNKEQNKLSDPDFDKNLKDKPRILTLVWQNANPNAQIEVQEPESDYFTYSNPADRKGHSGIIAHGWKKLIYHNLYKNIDVEFYYPEKGGIEYNIIAHPGATISDVKMKYSGATQTLMNGSDANILSPGLNLTDHAPIAKDEKGNLVASYFSATGNTISFITANYDKTQTLTIDPWITNPDFYVYNAAYDIAYDNRGNVYIGGGQPPYELAQFDSSGVLQWTYYTEPFVSGLDYWGDFTTDMRSGTSYIVRGLGDGNGYLNALKIDNAGNLAAQDSDPIPSTSYVEYWRIAFDYINNQLIVAAGEDYQASRIDTNLISVRDTALFNTSYPTHDMCMLALDGQGNAYMASNKTRFELDTSDFDNEIFKYSLPKLSSLKYSIYDQYDFYELVSLAFYPEEPNGGAPYANGFNGLAADKNMIVSYNGAFLNKWNAANGALKNSLKISSQDFVWSGLDLDCAGNIYVGDDNRVIVLDSSLTPLDTIPLSNRVFAVKVGNGKLYACGYEFVQSINIPANANAVITAAASPATYCKGGSTTITASGGNSYTWSPATGLSATTGSSVTAIPTVTTTYTVIGTSSCGTDTVTAVVTVTDSLAVSISAPPTICSGDSALLSASGGTSYTWSPSAGLNVTTGDSVFANPTATTTYIVTVTSAGGCTGTDTDVVTIIPAPNKPTITISVTGDSLISSATSDNQWFFDGAPIADSIRQVLVIKGHIKGWYSVTVTNEANGCNTTSDSTTSINQLTAISEQLSIYPNPFSNNIFVKINSAATNINEWSLQLTDVLGRTLYTKPSLNYSNEIDLSALPGGMYFITVTNKTARAVFPVVKQN